MLATRLLIAKMFKREPLENFSRKVLHGRRNPKNFLSKTSFSFPFILGSITTFTRAYVLLLSRLHHQAENLPPVCNQKYFPVFHQHLVANGKNWYEKKIEKVYHVLSKWFFVGNKTKSNYLIFSVSFLDGAI